MSIYEKCKDCGRPHLQGASCGHSPHPREVVTGIGYDDRGRAKRWPMNRNHEAAKRHVNDVLAAHGRWPGARRETHIAELLDDVIRERDQLRAVVYPSGKV